MEYKKRVDLRTQNDWQRLIEIHAILKKHLKTFKNITKHQK